MFDLINELSCLGNKFFCFFFNKKRMDVFGFLSSIVKGRGGLAEKIDFQLPASYSDNWIRDSVRGLGVSSRNKKLSEITV